MVSTDNLKEEVKNMSKIMYRCDNCGKFISARDFDHGATRKIIEPDNHFSGENYETICINCNKNYNEAS